MRIPRKFSLTAGVASLVAGLALASAANATTYVFDEPTGTDVIGITLSFTEDSLTVDVTGWRSTIQLHGVTSFSTSDLSWEEVIQDLVPPDGGLGVIPFGTDNLEGSTGRDFTGDEVLIFDFGGVDVTFLSAELNGEHTDTFADDTARFDIAYSFDGVNFTVLVDEGVPYDGAGNDTIATAGDVAAPYWAIFADGYTDSGYVESITVERAVPEPGTIALLGAGLIGLFTRRRRR